MMRRVRLIRSVRGMAAAAAEWRRRGLRVGLVPTMGALHEGHLSLIRAAAAQNDVVVVSLFVNPLQFGPGEDFMRYPRRLESDRRLATLAGADVLFAPRATQLYPPGFQTFVDPGPLARRWEGRARPGHFRGVATVVTLLCSLIRPTQAYVGQKDYQQALIVERLVRDLRFAIRVRRLPTVREPDGLAMSSRNASLSPAERRRAAGLYRALRAGRARIHAGERRARPILAAMRRVIRTADRIRLDYLAVADAVTLEPQPRLRRRVALLVAARVGRTRLIDNLLVDVS